jgi:2-dehydropantoate 2-reductase
MRVMIVGAGVIGSIYGWALSESGHEVVHLVRPGRAEALTDGIAFDLIDKRKGRPNRSKFRYHLAAAETIAGPFDLVIVPTKPYQLLDALGQIVPALGPDTQYLLLTQNWHGTEDIDEILPRASYMFGDAQAGGTWREGILVSAIFPRIVLGRVDGTGEDPGFQTFRRAFEAVGIRPSVPHNILHAIWIQYAVTAGLWGPMVRAGGLHELLADRRLGNLSLAAASEGLRVVGARGVDVSRYPESKIYAMSSSGIGRTIAGLGMRAMFRYSKAVTRTSEHALADPVEVETCYRDVLATARELGISAPVMESFEDDVVAFTALFESAKATQSE